MLQRLDGGSVASLSTSAFFSHSSSCICLSSIACDRKYPSRTAYEALCERESSLLVAFPLSLQKDAMHASTALAALLAAASAANAFSGTYPIVAWSSSRSVAPLDPFPRRPVIIACEAPCGLDGVDSGSHGSVGCVIGWRQRLSESVRGAAIDLEGRALMRTRRVSRVRQASVGSTRGLRRCCVMAVPRGNSHSDTQSPRADSPRSPN